MTTTRTAKPSLLGAWRIVETELWDVDDLDLIEPAHLTLKPRGHGRLGLLAIEAELDYRVVQREGLPAVEFSFEGFDDGGRISGRGWAALDCPVCCYGTAAGQRPCRCDVDDRPMPGVHLDD